jgi:hypothetical protein
MGASSSSSYSVLSYVTDVDRSLSVPIGVVLWSAAHEFVDVRVLETDERIASIRHPKDFALIHLAVTNLKAWIADRRLPYAENPAAPWTDAWWVEARSLMIHRVRSSEPSPIDLANADPVAEIDVLFESVVAPFRRPAQSKKKIHGEIARCLGDLAECFEYRERLEGYKHREIRVLRAYRGEHRMVVVEGLNLAAAPDEHADQMLGKLLRLREGNRALDLVVGYLPSPHGLNGEASLVEYLKEKTGAKAFDLIRERQQLHDTAADLVQKANGALALAPTEAE